jgi:hypothetical protein
VANSPALRRRCIDAKKFPKTAQGIVAFIQEVARRVSELNNNIQPDVLKGLADTFKIDDIEAFLRMMDKINAKGFNELKHSAQNLPPTADDSKKLAAYKAAVAALSNNWTQSLDAAAASLGMDTLLKKGASLALTGITIATAALSNTVRDNFKTMVADVTAEWERLVPAFQQKWEEFSSFLTDAAWPAITAGRAAALQFMTDGLRAWLVGMTETMQQFTAAIEAVAATIRDALGSALDWVSEKVSLPARSGRSAVSWALRVPLMARCLGWPAAAMCTAPAPARATASGSA